MPMSNEEKAVSVAVAAILEAKVTAYDNTDAWVREVMAFSASKTIVEQLGPIVDAARADLARRVELLPADPAPGSRG